MSQQPDLTGTEGERLDATVTVDSTFSSQQTQTIELRVEDFNSGTTVHTDSQQVTLQDSTDSQQITLSWPTSDGDKGVYDLFLESDQDTIQRLVEVIDFDIATVADNHWRFDEGSGSVAADSVGSFDADFGSAISWGSGEGEGGVYGVLDGSGGADLGTSSQSHWSHWVNSGVGGLGMWINPTNFDANAGDVYHLFGVNTSNPNRSLRLALKGATGSQVDFKVGTANDTNDTINLEASDAPNGDWTAIAVRADGTEAELYVDGSVVDSAAAGTTESGDIHQQIHIGNDPKNPRGHEGGIDDLWSLQSDPGEQAIKDWYNATKGNYP